MNINKNEDNYYFAPFTEQRREIRKEWNSLNSKLSWEEFLYNKEKEYQKQRQIMTTEKEKFLNELRKKYVEVIFSQNFYTRRVDSKMYGGMRLFCLKCGLLSSEEIETMEKSIDSKIYK